MTKGWYGHKHQHSMASRGIRSRYGGMTNESEILNNELKEHLIWLSGAKCSIVDKNKVYDDERDICNLEIHKILLNDQTMNRLEVVIDGTFQGERNKYFISGWYDRGSYWQPEDAGIDEVSYLWQEIDELKKKSKYIKNEYDLEQHKDYIKLLEELM